MYYSATTDPAGQPWTAASVTQEIGRLAYELFRVGNIPNEAAVCGNIVTARGIETGPVDEEACQKLEAGVREQLVEIEQMQRELQAIAAYIAQPGTPSVVGPGAVNVLVSEDGVPEFVITPADITPAANGTATAVLPDEGPPPRRTVLLDEPPTGGATPGTAPEAPGASKLLYAGAIALGLVLLLGGRKNR